MGFSTAQGKRKYMEDRVKIVENLVPEHESTIPYFAIFDGHGGEKAAEICCNEFHKTLSSDQNLIEGDVCQLLYVSE